MKGYVQTEARVSSIKDRDVDNHGHLVKPSWGAHGTSAQRAATERRLDALLTELDPAVPRFSASSVLDEE